MTTRSKKWVFAKWTVQHVHLEFSFDYVMYLLPFESLKHNYDLVFHIVLKPLLPSFVKCFLDLGRSHKVVNVESSQDFYVKNILWVKGPTRSQELEEMEKEQGIAMMKDEKRNRGNYPCDPLRWNTILSIRKYVVCDVKRLLG